MSKSESCAWCGSEIGRGAESDRSSLCPECQETFEGESCHPLHPMEERQPFHD